MRDNTMRLWTWQLPDWDITAQGWDGSRIEDAWGSDTARGLRRLYPRLHGVVGSADFVWCFPVYRHWAQLEVRRLWVLEVPHGAILQYVNASIWDLLVRGKCGDALEQGQVVSEEAAWSTLFLEQDKAFALLKHGAPNLVVPIVGVPIDPAWVIHSGKFNMGPDHPTAAFDGLPMSLERARRCRRCC